jgi:hypothetical protein
MPADGRWDLIRRLKIYYGRIISPTHRPALTPRQYSWYSFLLEAESTPGPQLRPEDLRQ